MTTGAATDAGRVGGGIAVILAHRPRRARDDPLTVGSSTRGRGSARVGSTTMASRPQPDPAAVPDARGTVLVVDDEPTIADVVGRYLRRAGYGVLTAHDGEEALRLAAEKAPDLVVLDVMLPRMDGLEVLRRLPADGTGARPAVILLTARGEEDDRVGGLGAGADDYVAKPFSPAELVARVDAVLRRTAPATGPGGTLDLRRRCASTPASPPRAGATTPTIALDPARARSAPLPRAPSRPSPSAREELMDAVWRFAFYTDTSTVTVHVRRLRSKDRGRPEHPALAADRVGRRLPVRPVSIRRSLAVAVPTVLVGALAIGLVYGPVDGLLTAAMATAVAVLGLGAAHVLVARRRRLGSLRRQVAVGGIVSLAAVLAAVALAAGLMFLSAHDAVVVCVLVACGSVVALRANALLAGDLLGELDRVRRAVGAVGEGAREPSLPIRGDDELARLAVSVNQAVSALDAAERARRELIAAVSHDLRTPITSLGLLAQAIDDDIADPETRGRYVAQMGTHLRSLNTLIDDLFELSRLEAGELGPIAGTVPVAALIDETLDALGVAAERQGVRVERAVDDEVVAAPANPERLQRVLVNLVENALRHSVRGGTVTVSAWRVGGRVAVEVANDGEPIVDADRERVFEAFYRGGSETARTRSGAGLGLAISRAIVEAHGGRIWLADDDARTRFRFAVPAPP